MYELHLVCRIGDLRAADDCEDQRRGQRRTTESHSRVWPLISGAAGRVEWVCHVYGLRGDGWLMVADAGCCLLLWFCQR